MDPAARWLAGRAGALVLRVSRLRASFGSVLRGTEIQSSRGGVTGPDLAVAEKLSGA